MHSGGVVALHSLHYEDKNYYQQGSIPYKFDAKRIPPQSIVHFPSLVSETGDQNPNIQQCDYKSQHHQSQKQQSRNQHQNQQKQQHTVKRVVGKMQRESHKDVERRRREVINQGITEMAKIVPNCSDRNKGGILHRAVQYIHQLKEAESSNAERWTLDKVLADQAINELTSVIECLKSENEGLRSQVIRLGGEAPPRSQLPSSVVPSYHPLAAAMQAGYHHYFPSAMQQPQQQPHHDHLSHQHGHWTPAPSSSSYGHIQLPQQQQQQQQHIHLQMSDASGPCLAETNIDNTLAPVLKGVSKQRQKNIGGVGDNDDDDDDDNHHQLQQTHQYNQNSLSLNTCSKSYPTEVSVAGDKQN